MRGREWKKNMRASLHWTPSDLPFTETYQHGQAEPVQTQVRTSLCVEKYSRLRWRGVQGIGQHQSDRARNDLGWNVTQAGDWQWHNWESQRGKAVSQVVSHLNYRAIAASLQSRQAAKNQRRHWSSDQDRFRMFWKVVAGESNYAATKRPLKQSRLH